MLKHFTINEVQPQVKTICTQEWAKIKLGLLREEGSVSGSSITELAG